MKKEQVPEVANMDFFECRCPAGLKYVEIEAVAVEVNATNCSDPELADSLDCQNSTNATNCSDPEFANSTECMGGAVVVISNLTALEGMCIDIDEWCAYVSCACDRAHLCFISVHRLVLYICEAWHVQHNLESEMRYM